MGEGAPEGDGPGLGPFLASAFWAARFSDATADVAACTRKRAQSGCLATYDGPHEMKVEDTEQAHHAGSLREAARDRLSADARPALCSRRGELEPHASVALVLDAPALGHRLDQDEPPAALLVERLVARAVVEADTRVGDLNHHAALVQSAQLQLDHERHLAFEDVNNFVHLRMGVKRVPSSFNNSRTAKYQGPRLSETLFVVPAVGLPLEMFDLEV